ncbi:MAG: histidine triad protein [Acidobacteriales bacterium]|nr:histidine triad protein [Terriglobales bacterium]
MILARRPKLSLAVIAGFILAVTLLPAPMSAQTVAPTLQQHAAEQKRTPAAVIADPVRDNRNPTSMSELAIPSNGQMMNGIMYLAAGAQPHPTVILLHGFPGNEQNLDLAQSIRRAGWNVLYFHYRGAWGSEGDFSFSNAMQDTLAAIKFLRDPINSVAFHIDLSRIVLVGHSMGGFMAAYAATQDPALSGIVLISPWNIGADAASWKGDDAAARARFKSTLTEFRGYQRALHNAKAETLMAEAMQHRSDWDLTHFLTQLRAPNKQRGNIPVLLTYGTHEGDYDEVFPKLKRALESDPKSQAAANSFVTLPTDHPYSDHRIALQSAVVDWLQRLAKQ